MEFTFEEKELIKELAQLWHQDEHPDFIINRAYGLGSESVKELETALQKVYGKEINASQRHFFEIFQRKEVE